MAIRKILVYPDPELRNISVAVTEFNDELKQLVSDMAETMYAAPGIGLAAIQVNVAQRVIVMDLSDARNELRVFINPEITDLNQGTREMEEGCLSVPGIYVSVERPQMVHIKAQNLRGEVFEEDADELLSVCIQHEVDHLNGKVFVDYLSKLKQVRLRKKIKKESKLAALETV